MFTFIRIAAMHVLNGDHNKKTEVEETTEENSERVNPWQGELDRLAYGSGLTRTPRRPNGSYLPKVHMSQNKPASRTGTLADLKVWWGKATATYRPPNTVDRTFSPPPVKKRNRWYNF